MPRRSRARADASLNHQAVSRIRMQAAAAPGLHDTAPPPNQDPLSGPSDGVLPVEPVRNIYISILTDRGIVTAPIATFDKAFTVNYIDRRTVELLNLPHGPCQGEAEWRYTPRGSKLCFREAVFPFMLPIMYQLELSRTPKQVRMHIIEEDFGPLIYFGKHFQNEMEMGVYGNNLIHPHLHPHPMSPPVPDLASHQFIPQAFPGSI